MNLTTEGLYIEEGGMDSPKGPDADAPCCKEGKCSALSCKCNKDNPIQGISDSVDDVINGIER